MTQEAYDHVDGHAWEDHTPYYEEDEYLENLPR